MLSPAVSSNTYLLVYIATQSKKQVINPPRALNINSYVLYNNSKNNYNKCTEWFVCMYDGLVKYSLLITDYHLPKNKQSPII